MIAALAMPEAGPVAGRTAELLLLVGAMALLPAALVTLTSFLKISVVLSVARSALGAPQVPPATAVTTLALLLTAVVMAPVAVVRLHPNSSVRGLSIVLINTWDVPAPMKAPNIPMARTYQP